MSIARKSHPRGKPTRAIGTGVAPSPSRPGPALALAGVRPSKSRGQNFLANPKVAERIVAAAELDESDDVIEIGPGLGILTERIVMHPHRSLTLVELEPRLSALLSDRFDASVSVVNADILSTDITAIAPDPPVKIIGNLPFNVAAAILRRLSDNARLISRMVLMFQREVAERIRARPGDRTYGALSVFTALYWEIDMHFVVAAGSFHPRPKIDAEVLRFTPHATRRFAPQHERTVLETIRASFSAPRKTIRNALGHSLGLEADPVARALETAAIDPGARAETLALEDFLRLADAIRPDLSSRIASHDA